MLLHNLFPIRNSPCYIAMEQVNLFVVHSPSVGNPWVKKTHLRIDAEKMITHLSSSLRLGTLVDCGLLSSLKLAVPNQDASRGNHVQAVSMTSSSFTAVQKLTHVNIVLHSYRQTNS